MLCTFGLFIVLYGEITLLVYLLLVLHCLFLFASSKMEWSEQKDVLLCREVLLSEPYKAKDRTTQRAQLWQTVADHLNAIGSPKFKVDKRSVREHLLVLMNQYKRKMRQEERASGISPETSELDTLLEEILERTELAAEENQGEKEQARKKVEKEKEQAQDVRLKAMERLAETKKRNEDQTAQAEKIKRV